MAAAKLSNSRHTARIVDRQAYRSRKLLASNRISNRISFVVYQTDLRTEYSLTASISQHESALRRSRNAVGECPSSL
jgi:hypothetical protein